MQPGTKSPVIESSFFSQTLGRKVPYVLWLPESARSSPGRCPLLICLHGAGRNYRTLIEQRGVLASLRGVKFAVAWPNGDNGWWIDSPVNADSRYQSMLVEFIHHVEATHRVGGGRSLRAVTGWSMGGYGAFRFAEDHPELIAAVSSMIGLLNFPLGRGHSIPEKVFGPPGPAWEKLTPTTNVGALKGMQLAVFSCSTGFDRPHNEAFHEALRRAGIPHQYETIAGGHVIGTVLAAWPKVLAFHGQVWASQEAADRESLRRVACD